MKFIENSHNSFSTPILPDHEGKSDVTHKDLPPTCVLGFKAWPHSVSSIISKVKFKQSKYAASSHLCKFRLLMFK